MAEKTECNVCSKEVLDNDTSICCDICNTWIHFGCSGIEYNDFATYYTSARSWQCKKCLFSMLPFDNLTNYKLVNQSKYNIETQVSKLISTGNYISTCNICKMNVTNKNKSIPCAICKSLLHRKCIKLNQNSLNYLLQTISTSMCQQCLTDTLPFMKLNSSDTKQSIISGTVTSKIKPNKYRELNVELLKQFKPLNYSESSDSKNNELGYTNKTNCNYYNINDFNSELSNLDDKSFSIFHTNISSLNANFDNLDLLLTDINFSFDVIALSETHIPKSKEELIIPGDLPGYQLFTGTSGTSMKSGTGFYISDKLSFVPREDLNKHVCNVDSEFETEWIEIISPRQSKKNFVIGSFYRHPNRSDKSFLQYLQTILNKIKKENKIFIMSGDFNYNLLHYEKNINVALFLDTMYSNYFSPQITLSTRVVNNVQPSLIDNIFINNIDYSMISGNLISKISDHMPNSLILKNAVEKNIKPKVMSRNFTTFNEKEFLNDLEKSNMHENILKNQYGTSEKYSLFYKTLMSIVDKHAPIKTLSRKEIKTSHKPWITKGILHSINLKNKYYKKFCQDKRCFLV